MRGDETDGWRLSSSHQALLAIVGLACLAGILEFARRSQHPPLDAVMVIGVIAVTLYFTWQGLKHLSVENSLLFSTDGIFGRREYHRIVTSGFVHADWPHVIFNLFSLYAFGSDMEMIYGPVTFGLVYFAGIVGGSLLSLVLHRYETYRALGASGGVCGVIFASIFLLPGGKIGVFPIPFYIPAYLYAILFVLASAYGIRWRVGNIGHDAHLGGALIGLGTATALYPNIIQASPVLYGMVVGLSLVLLTGLYWRTRAVNPRRRVYPVSKVSTARMQQDTDDKTMDELLDKISKFGMNHLSAEEKDQLNTLSRKRKSRR